MRAAHGRRVEDECLTPGHLARVHERDDFGLGPASRLQRWARARDLDDAGQRRFVRRLGGIRALLDASEAKNGRRAARPAASEAYLLALMRIEGRYERWRPAGLRVGGGVDRAVLRNVAQRGGVEFRLYRRIATSHLATLQSWNKTVGGTACGRRLRGSE
jgi:hypothetical protein